MQYVALLSDYFHQEEMHLRLTHIVVCISSFFLFLAEEYPIVSLYNNSFIHSPSWSCFQLLTLLSKAATNIYV